MVRHTEILTLITRTTDGKTTERETKASEVTWRDAETHASEYIGTIEAHALLVELKGKPHKMAPEKKP